MRKTSCKIKRTDKHIAVHAKDVRSSRRRVWSYAGCLRRRLAGRDRASVLAGVLSADGEAADARSQEREGVALILRVEVVTGPSRGRSVSSGLESSLSSTAVERTGRVRTRSGAKVRVERWIRSSTASQSGRKGISAGRAAELLAITAARRKPARRGGKGSGAGSTSHGALSHVIGRRSVHWGRVARVGNHSSTSATGAATQTADILGEVVVAANLVTALPVASTEGNNAAATHSAVTTAVVTVVTAAHMRRGGHHGWWTISVTARITHVAGWTSTDSREGAAEAGGPTLEVREAARWASPVTWPGPVLTRREWRQDFGGAVQDSAR